MRSGRLRHWVIIDKKAKTRNSYGEEVIAWTTNIGTWAQVSPIRGTNYFASMQLQASITHQVTMRYQTLANTTEIKPGYCRVRLGSTGGRTLNIISVINPEERNIMLELMCAEEL
jgi:SPP1 family predicted phage head-tail adaptor